MSQYTAVLDIGSSKVICLICSPDGKDSIVVHGAGIREYKGYKRGIMEGFGEYLADAHDDRLQMEAFHGTHTYEEAVEAVCRQIDNACLIPYLMLKHKNEKGPLEDYIWHWFILAGYEKKEDDLLVKAISYGEHKWFSLKEMWDTGYDKKGGMILYHI